jgi:CubicO group peptidase (beta-lactamase class C family)
MSLVEEGKIALSDPVSRFIPQFAHTTVLQRADSGSRSVPAQRPITIRDLLTHTAGISYGTDSGLAPLYAAKGLGPAAGYGWYFADKQEPICTSIERLASLPFAAQPGTKFVYGYNTDILGCVIERVSGLPLDVFLERRITGPLGMRDTHFFLPPSDRGRFTTVYASTDGDTVVRAVDGPHGQGDYVDGPRQSFSGGAGLLSTARDYGRFLEMLRNGGALEGVRILAPSTVALMTTNQIDTITTRPGHKFGLGFEVLLRPGADARVESVGTFSWGGAYGSMYEVDPVKRVVLVFMIQQLPNRSTLAARLPMMVYQAMVGG